MADPFYSGGAEEFVLPETSMSPEELLFQMSPPARTFVDPFDSSYFGDRGGANWLAGDEYHKGMGGGENIPSGGTELYPGWTGSGVPTGLDKFSDFLKSMGGKAMNFAQTPQGLMALIAALASAAGRQRATGGGPTMGMMAPRQYTRRVDPSGIVRYAAEGGLMHAYANGGHVQMEDGGFVMTKKAVDGAGGPRGIQQLVPGARMIGGPPDPTGKRDLTSAVIHGPNGTTPAKVSRGEAYVPPGHDTKKLYALMHSLERKA